jgi:mannose-6-phosphate isomerase-like protein (cupin superfamily)
MESTGTDDRHERLGRRHRTGDTREHGLPTVLWTGEHTQLTVMRIETGGDMGLEVHPDHDQFLRVEQGSARVELGPTNDEVEETHEVEADLARLRKAEVDLARRRIGPA